MTTATAPRVSIVIPVFNGADYLREAIDSALAQTYPNVEVVVVNDGSRDGGATEAIARSYGDRIRYIAKENGGVASALNVGIREMTGDYFSWLSHDDVYRPEKIERQVARLEPGASPVVLYGDYEMIDGTGAVLGVRRVSTGGLPMRLALIAKDPVNGCTVLVPRICFEVVGTFDVGLRTFQDYDLWFRLARAYPFVHVPELLVKSRVHPAQGSRTIPAFFSESSRQMIRLLHEVDLDEIRAAHRGPPSTVFTRLALTMKLRGYDEVARAALDLSRRHAREDDAAARLQRGAVAIACSVLTKKMKPSYWAARLRSRPRNPTP